MVLTGAADGAGANLSSSDSAPGHNGWGCFSDATRSNSTDLLITGEAFPLKRFAIEPEPPSVLSES